MEQSLGDEEMGALLVEKSQGEHTLEFILSHQFDRDGWSETLDRMIDYGADISPEEKEMFIVWLLKNAGKG